LISGEGIACEGFNAEDAEGIQKTQKRNLKNQEKVFSPSATFAVLLVFLLR
jgi:hypothetical protein